MGKVMSNRQSLTDGVPVRVCGIPEMSPYTVDPVKGTVYGYTAPPKLVSSSETNTHEVEEVKLIHVM